MNASLRYVSELLFLNICAAEASTELLFLNLKKLLTCINLMQRQRKRKICLLIHFSKAHSNQAKSKSSDFCTSPGTSASAVTQGAHEQEADLQVEPVMESGNCQGCGHPNGVFTTAQMPAFLHNFQGKIILVLIYFATKTQKVRRSTDLKKKQIGTFLSI